MHNGINTVFILVQFFRQNSWIARWLPSSGPVYLIQKNLEKFPLKTLFNPLTPMNDRERICSYDDNTISSRQVMRMKENIN